MAACLAAQQSLPQPCAGAAALQLPGDAAPTGCAAPRCRQDLLRCAPRRCPTAGPMLDACAGVLCRGGRTRILPFWMPRALLATLLPTSHLMRLSRSCQRPSRVYTRLSTTSLKSLIFMPTPCTAPRVSWSPQSGTLCQRCSVSFLLCSIIKGCSGLCSHTGAHIEHCRQGHSHLQACQAGLRLAGRGMAQQLQVRLC